MNFTSMEMTFAFWCIPLAMFLPLIWAGFAKAGASGYDNSQPRAWLAKLEGRAKRADWAQQNSYEAFPPFVAGVIVAHLTGSEQMVVDILAGFFMLFRIAHGAFYILDNGLLRSLSWAGGFACTLGFFLV